MNNFSDILKNSILQVNNGFEKAHEALVKVIGQLTTAIEEIGAFACRLSEVENRPEAAIYRLSFDPNPDDIEVKLIHLAMFRIPSYGFPIETGNYIKNRDEFVIENIIEDEAALESLFKDILSDPNSSLVQAIGFALRSKL